MKLQIKRGTILRAFFACQALLIWGSGMFEPQSLHYEVTQSAGLFGVLAVTGMGFFGALALIETLINDVMPCGYTFQFGLNNRHLIFMLMAMFQGAEFFIAVRMIDSLVLSLWCLFNVIFLTVAAFRDVTLRYKKDVIKCAN